MSKKTVTEIKAVEEKKEQKFSIGDCRAMLQLMGIAAQEVKGEKALYWLSYYSLKLKPIDKAFVLARQGIEGTEKLDAAYELAQTKEDFKTAENNNQEVVSKIKGLLGEEADITIRPFKSEWLSGAGASAALMKLLTEFELIDNIENLEKILYED